MKLISSSISSLAIIGGLIGSLNFIQAAGTIKPVQSVSADDMDVMLQAVEATTPVAAESVPRCGTFYSAQFPNWPPLPANINSVPAWDLGDGVFLLNDLDINYSQQSLASSKIAGSMMAMDVPAPGDGSGDGTNSYTFNASDFTVDYGTNLWIAQVGISSESLVGIASNSLADISYEIQSLTDLTQAGAGWGSEGFILGSELTNWTPFSVAMNNRTNLFVRIRSWADSTGSGIPDWWWLQNFGQTTNVDAYANPAGDGWNNLEKFLGGMNPNVFYTPPAPQGLTVSYNSVNGNVNVSWQPSPGLVTGYTVEKYDGQTWQTTDFNFSNGTDSFEDTVSDVPPVNGNGPDIYVTYRIVAHYGTHGDSFWSNPVLLEPSSISGSIVAGPQGSAYLAVSVLPTGTVKLRLTRIDFNSDFWDGDPANDTNFDISISAFTNGLALLPDSWLPMPIDPDRGVYYDWYLQTIDANGNPSAPAYLINVRGGPLSYNNRLVPLYFDGRQQIKDNLRFLLRAAGTAKPFAFLVAFPNIVPKTHTWPTNYVSAGFYRSGEQDVYPQGFDPTRPIYDNYFYRNFVFDPNNLNTATGLLNTGCYYVPYANYLGYSLVITNNPSYFFNEEDYITAPNPVVLSSLLSASQTTWILPDYQDGIGNVSSGADNVYGLPYVSVKDAYFIYDQLYLATYNPGDSVPDGICYRQAAQPNFQTVGYYFANNPAPEQDDFSSTNTSSLLIEGVSQQKQIFVYAKLAVLNDYSGVYAYLGQYFDKAYKMTTGIVTTNTTGILSPYGSFFATEPGPAALVTMPDVDTGERGTCTVYCVSVVLDKNHDGKMDLYFAGLDATSVNSPCIFWVDRNYDRFTTDADDGVQYDDDVSSTSQAAKNLYTGKYTPDYDYLDGAGHRVISCERDLQDFTRLWVCGITTNLLAALPAGSTITLNWGDVGSPNSGNPTIDLFAAADADGGMGYLTNSATAGSQIDSLYCPYIGRLGPGGSLQLNASTFANHWAGNHFIWCGVSNGTGGLNLTIKDGSGNVLAQTTAYIQLVDIKQMYERWTIGDTPSIAPKTNAIAAVEDLPPLTPAFQYTPPTDTNTPYILFVHGWNMERWEKDRFAEAAFKRLYWQGYQGRFGSFRWPTGFGFTGGWTALTDPRNYDNSEYQAWQSAAGLLNKLNDLNAEYPGHVYMLAHSMGNVVAGEALRLAGNNQVVNTYVASQAALPAHNYDAAVTTPYLLQFTYTYPTEPLHTLLGNHNYGPDTPNIYGNRLTNAVAASRRVNFYNQNDFALAAPRWCFDEITKPDYIPPNNYYYYNGSLSDPAPWNKFKDSPIVGDTGVLVDIVTNLNNRYKIMSYAAESYSTALGATPGITTFNDRLDLTTVWPADSSGHSYGDHFWHSAQFRGDCWQEWNYWNTLLRSDRQGFNISNP